MAASPLRLLVLAMLAGQVVGFGLFPKSSAEEIDARTSYSARANVVATPCEPGRAWRRSATTAVARIVVVLGGCPSE